MGLQLARVSGVEHLAGDYISTCTMPKIKCIHSLGHVEIELNLVITFELHDQERITRLALSQRWIQTDGDEGMRLIGLRQQHKLLDRVILDLVVVRLATETEGALV